MSSPAFVAYIDESGDEGWKFGKGSSEWFVLSAVVFWKPSELEQVKLVDEVRAKINEVRQGRENIIHDRKPLHFRDLRHEQKKFYAARIAEAKLRTISVCIHKPSLTKPERFNEQSKLYFYSTRLLVERIGRLCHGLSPSNCATELCFSNRASMDYESLKSYLAMLNDNRANFDFGGRPGVFSQDRVTILSPGKRMGLQIADAVACSYYLALEPNAFGQTESAYATLMLPKAAKGKNRYWGEGVKFMPKEAEEKQKGGILYLA